MAIKSDHIIVKATENGEGTFTCLHCGATYTPRFPVAVDIWLAMADQFCKSHRRCNSPVQTKIGNQEAPPCQY